MIEGLFAAGLLAIFVGVSHKTPEVDNKNTQYCVSAPTRSNPKQERVVTTNELVQDSRCSKGTMTTEPSRRTPLSERKSK